jgi:MFS transporter, Spinster family, sphingosine-1-phosphate transporter
LILLFLLKIFHFFFFEYIIGVLNEIIDFYKIDDSLAELIQLILNFGFIISAPLFGYLGDKYKRKWIITFGICFWSLMNLIGSFIPANVIIFSLRE